MKKIRNITIIAMMLIIAAGLTAFVAVKGNQITSVGKNGAKTASQSFQTILKQFSKNVGYHDALSHWGFKMPSGEKFEWTKDMSANKVDLAMVLMTDQFTKAGLDTTKLDKNLYILKPTEVEAGVQLPNRLIIAANLSDKKKRTMGYADAFKNVLAQDNAVLKLDKTTGYYMLSLGNGNEVHWSVKTGSKAEIMFVIQAEALVKAGLDVTKLKDSGWVFEAAGKGTSGKNKDQLVKEFKLK